MENIVRTIRVYYPVSDEALATLAHGFEKQVFPVKTLIIRAGQFDRQVHFIEKGMTRSYTLHDGKEITTWFSMEGDVACGSWDLYRNKAGFEYVETLEETLVYSISIETLNELYKSDIDIAIEGNIDKKDKFNIVNEFDMIDMVYTMDIVFIEDITKKEFLDSILKEGINL